MKNFDVDMHDGFLHSNREIVNELLTHIPEIAHARRASDSAIREMDSFELTRPETLALLQTFDRNYGKFVDGTLHRLHLGDVYSKISTNLSLARIDGVHVVDKSDLFKIIKMTELASKEKGSVSLFVNGLKVPDELIYVYMTESQTDILFPRIYMNVDGSNTFYIEKRIYPKYQYINRYFPYLEGRVCQFALTNEELTKSNLKPVSVLVYVDGRLIISPVTITRIGTNTVNVELENEVGGRRVELIIDSAVKSKNTFITPTSTNVASWYIPELYGMIDLLNGPISKSACYFYVDGIRIANKKVKQVGRLNFIYDDVGGTLSVKNCTCCFTDRDMTIIDTKFNMYGDDYYLSNMLGPLNITRLLINNYQNDYFTGLDFHKILNNNSKMYNLDTAKELYDIVDRYQLPDDQTKQLIKRRHSLARDFLNCFAKRDLYKDVVHTNQEYHTVSFNTDKVKYSEYEFVYIVDINGNHVPDHELEIIDQGIREFVKIPGRFFRQGDNKLRIVEVKKRKNSGIEYKIFNPSVISNTNGLYTITTEFFRDKLEPNDYIILEVSDDEPSYLYDKPIVGDVNRGWKVKRDARIESNLDGTMTIIMDTFPEDEICLYCKKFVFKFNYTVPNNITTLSDMTIPVRSQTLHRLPVIANGKYRVFVNNKLLYENLDYYFRHPENYKYTTYTVLCIRRHIKEGDLVTVYFTDNKQDVVFISEGSKYNHFGLIYMRDLKYPYSPEYIDIYIDGKFISKDKIEILSDKLIRIPEEVQPFRDVYAETNFRVDCDSFDFFLEDWEESDIDKHIVQYFPTLIKMSPTSIEKLWYDSLDDNVDSVNKLPNPYDGSISDIVRYDLLVNAYFLWLRSYSSKTIIKAHEEIDPVVVAYFKLYADASTGERKDVVAGANRIAFYEPMVLGSRHYYHDKTEKLAKLLDWGSRRLQGTRNMLEIYTSHLRIANDLYPRDLPHSVSSRSIVNRVRDICLGGRNHEED